MNEENQNLDPNRPPEEFQEGGGPAVKPKNKIGVVDGVTEQGRDKLAKVAGEATGDVVGGALTSSGVGAALAGVGRWVTKRATELAAKWGLKDNNWLKIALAPIIALILMFTIGAIAIAGIVKANRGAFGNSAPEYVSASSADYTNDMRNIEQILGESTIVPGDPLDWYFNQGDSRWGDKPGQAGGWSVNKYRSRACAITSAAMIAKYYGAVEADPYFLGGYNARAVGSMLLDLETWKKYVNEKAGANKKVVSVAKNIESVKYEISHGNPILAQGVKAFRASGQHWVVIIGISGDGRYLVLHDPSAVKSRGMPVRYSPADELSNGLIKNLYTLHD